MHPKAIPFAAILAAVPVPAYAVQGPDGYHCTVEAFTNIGAIHGRGVGEVSLRADPQYRATAATFTYDVRDTQSGYGRMSATWDLGGARADGMSPIRSLWLPFHRGLPASPTSVSVTLDEGRAESIAIADQAWLQKESSGRANGLRLPAAAAPELRGRRTFAYKVKAGDGTDLATDLFLMPNWKKVPGRVRSALGRARSMLRKKKCNPFYIVGRAGG